MKELWIETSKQDALSNLIKKYCDVVVEGDKASFLATIQETTVLSPTVESFEKLDVKGKVLRICINDKATEDLIVKAAEKGACYLLVSTENWRVIPLENLIARIKGKSKLIAEVTNAEEAKVALETLELGTDGVLLKTSDADELLKTVATVKPEALKLEMAVAKIVSTKTISNGARVRPFRVNAGSCSMYTLGNLQTTRYLQEFKAGDEVILVNREGKTRKANVGRIKIEIRPLFKRQSCHCPSCLWLSH